MLPTFCELAGVAVPEDRRLDGRSILPYMMGARVDVPVHDAFFVPGKTVQYKQWKLFLKDQKPGGHSKAGEGMQGRLPAKAGSLFNLAEDLGETTDVSSRYPERVDELTGMMQAFMEDQVKAQTPFYLQISHYAMHAGAECLTKTRAKYVNHPAVQAWYKAHDVTAETVRRKEDPAVWLGMGEDLDGRIGAVLDKIDELGIADNTYVVLMSDNGYRHHFFPGLAQPHHGLKWWVWQGGIRVPMIVRGPGIKPGSVFRGNVINYDLLPTFVDWAGGETKRLEHIDGVSLADYMAGKIPDSAFLNRYLYFHYPHYRSSMPHSAIVSGTKKVMHFYDRPDIPMLFDLAESDGEVHNIAKEYPEEHARLYGEMMRYFGEVGARIPKPNPDYDPELYKQAKEYDMRVRYGAFEGKRRLSDDEQ